VDVVVMEPGEDRAAKTVDHDVAGSFPKPGGDLGYPIPDNP
jgi:hypothetical protein